MFLTVELLVLVDTGESVETDPKDFYAIPDNFQEYFDNYAECASCVILKGCENWPGKYNNFLEELDVQEDAWEFEFLDEPPLEDYYQYVKCDSLMKIAKKYSKK